MKRVLFFLLALLAAVSLAAACKKSATAPDGAAVFRVRVCEGSDHAPAGETFRVEIVDPGRIAEAQALVGRGHVQILSGSLRAGTGGVNAPWSWHLAPETVAFADFAIELCDGCPTFIEEDLGYWLDTVGSYCPWSTEIEARER
jgi:hypothetical protein